VGTERARDIEVSIKVSSGVIASWSIEEGESFEVIKARSGPRQVALRMPRLAPGSRLSVSLALEGVKVPGAVVLTAAADHGVSLPLSEPTASGQLNEASKNLRSMLARGAAALSARIEAMKPNGIVHGDWSALWESELTDVYALVVVATSIVAFLVPGLGFVTFSVLTTAVAFVMLDDRVVPRGPFAFMAVAGFLVTILAYVAKRGTNFDRREGGDDDASGTLFVLSIVIMVSMWPALSALQCSAMVILLAIGVVSRASFRKKQVRQAVNGIAVLMSMLSIVVLIVDSNNVAVDAIGAEIVFRAILTMWIGAVVMTVLQERRSEIESKARKENVTAPPVGGDVSEKLWLEAIAQLKVLEERLDRIDTPAGTSRPK